MNERNALCIGIDAYPGSNRLSGCVNDANAWADFFKRQGFGVSKLIDHEATFEGILGEMRSLVGSASSGDVIAIQYSGHGTNIPDEDGEELDGQDEALVPIDFESNGFIIDDLIGPILDTAAAGVAINVFFDCCHSGGGTRLLVSPTTSDEKARFMPLTHNMLVAHRKAESRRKTEAKRTTKALKTRGFPKIVSDAAMREVLFAACQPFELALESGGNGQFTLAAMSVLGSGSSNLTNAGFLQKTIAAMGGSRKQTPQLSSPKPLENQSFLVAPQTGEASPPPEEPKEHRMRSEEGKKGRSPQQESTSTGSGHEIVSKSARGGGNSRGGEPKSPRGKPLSGFPAPGSSKGGVPLNAKVGKQSGGNESAREIFGPDDRIQISASDVPFRHICYLEYVTADGSRMRGSGWLVGPTTVITAGHCVWDREHGNDFVRSMQVFPARNGNSIPASATAIDFQTVAAWANNGNTAYDYGAVYLDRPLGDDFGFFSFAEFPDDDLQKMIVNIVGYPGEVNPPLMYGQANRLDDVRAHELVYTIDTTPGQSGCPVICFEGADKFTVVGIHNEGGSEGNFATRITSDVFDNIKKWKNH